VDLGRPEAGIGKPALVVGDQCARLCHAITEPRKSLLPRRFDQEL
jgi:hypothetical protein